MERAPRIRWSFRISVFRKVWLDGIRQTEDDNDLFHLSGMDLFSGSLFSGVSLFPDGIWVWVKIEPPGDHRFWSMFPLARVLFGVPIFDPTAIWFHPGDFGARRCAPSAGMLGSNAARRLGEARYAGTSRRQFGLLGGSLGF